MKRTLIVGATTNPARYAYKAAEMLTESGHPIVPIGIKKGVIFGEKIQNNWDTPQRREIIWRSRAKESATLIAKIIQSKETPEKERPKYFRALDFQSASQRDEALLQILQENP